MHQISVTALKEKMEAGENIHLIDVREPHEHEEFNIGGLLIPMEDIMTRAEEIPKDKPVIFYCRKGIRSGIAIQRLHQKFGFTNLFNLKGGMDAWRKEFEKEA
ncbi:rhodanese-like domain-containing protein [Danxiaibacter flavus]|uniref:Rhodanese-like domain-containing protein n=1 Tax=Danxiaibacter flavus TaxID=3049108 RepID=A0ABV3Z9Y6_9BACT|nr:rhodanese-like domain-containing protein [Chitinophagaceae bacterium DXS]